MTTSMLLFHNMILVNADHSNHRTTPLDNLNKEKGIKSFIKTVEQKE